jgi:hypothetical protein
MSASDYDCRELFLRTLHEDNHEAERHTATIFDALGRRIEPLFKPSDEVIADPQRSP